MRKLATLLAASLMPAIASANTAEPGRWNQTQVPSDLPSVEERLAQRYSCAVRLTCKAIQSCEEANWYLQNCPWGGRLDRDGDGRPCESGPC